MSDLNLDKFIFEEYLNSDIRILSKSDIDKSEKTSKFQNDNINKSNLIIIDNNSNHNYEIDNINNNKDYNNKHNNKGNNNINNNSDINNNEDINNNNINNIEDINNNSDIINITNDSNDTEDKKFYLNLILELKGNNFIFTKDYFEQKTDEKNKKYVKWLQNIYKTIHFPNDKKYLNKIKIHNNYETLNYSDLYGKLKNNLFTCTNPKCKSIIYISKNQKNSFKKIQNLEIKDLKYDNERNRGYNKVRCPLCLKYRCKYCNKLSSLKISFCCPFQAFIACYNSNFSDYMCPYILLIYTPFVRVWLFGFMFSFPFFKSLTRPDYLLLTKREIQRRKNDMYSREAFGLYFTKNERDLDPMNIFHISGSILWTFAYVIIFEEFLVFFMLISLIFNKNYFKKFCNCFYSLCFLPC